MHEIKIKENFKLLKIKQNAIPYQLVVQKYIIIEVSTCHEKQILEWIIIYKKGRHEKCLIFGVYSFMFYEI